MNKNTGINRGWDKYLSSRRKLKKSWFSKFRLHKKLNEENVSPEIIQKMLESDGAIQKGSALPKIKEIAGDPKITAKKIENNKSKEKFSFLNKLSFLTKIKFKKNEGSAIKKLQKEIQKLTQKKEALEETNKDALEVWKISQELLKHLPQNEQDDISILDDFKNYKKKIEILAKT
jgi:hypothetical protein